MGRVLVCEDDEDIAFLAHAVLTGRGWSVLAVGTVADALGALEAEPFDLVVTDLGLPDASGVNVCEAASAIGTKVVVMTANPRLGDLPVVRRNAEVVLAKPFDLETLADAVDAAAA